MKYLLDTNIISNAIRFPMGSAAARIALLEIGELSTSILVAGELKFGARKKNSSRLENLVNEVLEDFEVLPWEMPADDHYARIRAELEEQGQPIGQMDLLIAAQASALDLILVTDNEREFSRVPGLKIENWLR